MILCLFQSNIVSYFFWVKASDNYFNFLSVYICFIHKFCRKGLVEFFDLIEKGEMEDGPQLSSLVSQMHKYRY